MSLRDEAEDFLQEKEIFHHPYVGKSSGTDTYDVADIMAEFAQDQITDLVDQLRKFCTEKYTLGGIRFTGITESDLVQIAERFGYKNSPPF